MLAACSSMRHYEWTEDLRLSDGRTVLVHRSEDRRRVIDPGTGFQEGWLFQKSTMYASLPAPINRTVSWEGSLAPVALDIYANETCYLVNIVPTLSGSHEWRVAENEYYVAFRLAEHGWERIPLSSLPDAVQPNLLGNTYKLFIERGAPSGTHIDLNAKSVLQSDPLLVEPYKRIVRLSAPAKK